MFGYFSPDNKSAGFDAPTIEISKFRGVAPRLGEARRVESHRGFRRLRSERWRGDLYPPVTIKDIPQTCYLGKYNPYDPFDTENKTLTRRWPSPQFRAGDKLLPRGCEAHRRYTLTAHNKDWPGYVSKSHPINGYNYKEVMEDPNLTTDEARIKAMHGENVNALYFYENMQGKGEDGTPPTSVSRSTMSTKTPAWCRTPQESTLRHCLKDAKKYGSYIEVKAYYNSNNSTEKQGEITYRFMLGKDTHLDYNAERNYHYKLTPMFKGWANDVDWHIDYKKTPLLCVTRAHLYISYLYNHSAMIPIEFDAPEDVTIKRITADIVQNNWYPTDCKYPVNLTLNTNS